VDDPGVLLDQLLPSPSAIARLSPEEAALALERLSRLQVVLVARLSARSLAPETPESRSPEDRLLTPQEAAQRLGVNVRWLYRHANTFPFTRRLTRRTLRFNEAGLAKFVGQNRVDVSARQR
jgi:predicted DNA-binding transcriptional regulator AlpA